jgi:basic amino acid/polyamine antiporter, APA family
MNEPASEPIATSQRLGPWMCTALVVGNIVGSGIFLLPATLAPFALNSVPAWLFTIAGALLLAKVFATLARAMPHAGGPYAYARLAFGPFVAFIVAWGYWISIWVGNAAIATGAVAYLGVLAPSWVATPQRASALTLATVWLLTAVNCLGVRRAGGIQLVTTVLKLLPLIVVAVLGIVAVSARPQTLTDAYAATTFSLSSTTAAAALTLWALLGLESATVPADKVRDPARNVPLATFWGTLVAAALYLLSCTAVQLLLPASELARSTAPFADAMRDLLGNRAALAVALFAAISALGALNGWILLQGELPRAMAADGVFPRVFARQSANGSPVQALVIGSVLVSVLVVLNASRSLVDVFTFMVLLSTTAALTLYLATALAAEVLRRRGLLPDLRRPRVFGAIAAAGAVYALWMLVGAGAEAVAWGAALLATGVPVYAMMRAGARPR